MTNPALRVSDDKYSILDLDMGEYVVSVTHLKPNQSTCGHKHDWEECYYIACGIGRMKIGDKTKEISMGQFKVIELNVFHQIFNDSLMTLSFVCVWGKEKEREE